MEWTLELQRAYDAMPPPPRPADAVAGEVVVLTFYYALFCEMRNEAAVRRVVEAIEVPRDPPRTEATSVYFFLLFAIAYKHAMASGDARKVAEFASLPRWFFELRPPTHVLLVCLEDDYVVESIARLVDKFS